MFGKDLTNHPLLGKRVRVTMARKGEPVGLEGDFLNENSHALRLTENVDVVGTLVRIAEEGDFDIRLNNGEMRYCWPALEITEEPL